VAALGAVEQVGGDAARRACRAALAAVERRRVPADGADIVAVLRAAVPGLVVESSQAWASAPPAAVRGAMVQAAAEALRNVARHAGRTDARLELRQVGGRYEVVVTDHGAGIRGSEPGVGRRLMSESMESIGGTAVWHPTPGGGTTVVLAWRPVSAYRPERNPLARRDDPSVRQALVIAPMVAYCWWWAATQPVHSRVAAMLLCALMSAGIAAFQVWFVRGPIGWRHSVAMAVVVPGFVLLTLRVAIDDPAVPLVSWWAILGGLVMALAAQQGPARYLVLPAATYLGACVWWALGTGTPMGVGISASLSTILIVTINGGVRRFVVRGALEIDRQQRDLQVRQVEAVHAHAAAEARRRLQEDLDADVWRVLDHVAAGAPITPEVHARAHRLRLRLRDFLYLGAMLPDALQAEIERGRARGTRVDLRVQDTVVPTKVLDGLADLLAAVLSVADPRSVVVYVDPPRLAVVPALTGAEAATLARRGVDVHPEPGRSRVVPRPVADVSVDPPTAVDAVLTDRMSV
jgi:hypothetical protein